MDVVKTYSNGFLDKIIYVEQPHIFLTELELVYKLIKALFGLKQAPYVWYKTSVHLLKKLQFK